MSLHQETRSPSDSFSNRIFSSGQMADHSDIAERVMDEEPLLSLVVPFYNEEAVIGHFFARVIPELERIPHIRFEILCVNDGSRDGTLDILVAHAI
jgi:cellulose synthase/poly-beta-1,6-N-acetylglucosamine synthase-like glycosyltransferase